MPTPEEVQRRHAEHIGAVTGQFKDSLSEMVNRASTVTTSQLRLDLRNRKIAATPENYRAMRGVDKMFMSNMDAAGFKGLVDSYVGQFSGQVHFFNETLDSITETFKHPVPKIKWSTDVRKVLVEQQVGAKQAIRSVVEAAAQKAKQKALFSIGALDYQDLVTLLSDQFHISVGQAEGLASTSMASYWRTLAGEGYRQIEDALPEDAELLYRYVGPKDKLTRQFCRKNVNKVRSREEWESMDNGQLPNPFLTGGGYRCRHHLVVEKIKGGRRAKIPLPDIEVK